MNTSSETKESSKTKIKYRQALVEYWCDEESSHLPRKKIAESILGISKQALYKLFAPDELDEIERECLKTRRKRYLSKLMKVDDALFRRAMAGNIPAIKLCYQRFEAWNPNNNAEDPPDKIIIDFESVREE